MDPHDHPTSFEIFDADDGDKPYAPGESLCGPGCAYRPLYEGAQRSLADMSRRHSESIAVHDMLREAIVSVLKHTFGNEIRKIEAETGTRFDNQPDRVLIRYLERFVRTLGNEHTQHKHQTAQLRSALALVGIAVPDTDDLSRIVRAIEAPVDGAAGTLAGKVTAVEEDPLVDELAKLVESIGVGAGDADEVGVSDLGQNIVGKREVSPAPASDKDGWGAIMDGIGGVDTSERSNADEIHNADENRDAVAESQGSETSNESGEGWGSLIDGIFDDTDDDGPPPQDEVGSVVLDGFGSKDSGDEMAEPVELAGANVGMFDGSDIFDEGFSTDEPGIADATPDNGGRSGWDEVFGDDWDAPDETTADGIGGPEREPERNGPTSWDGILDFPTSDAGDTPAPTGGANAEAATTGVVSHDEHADTQDTKASAAETRAEQKTTEQTQERTSTPGFVTPAQLDKVKPELGVVNSDIPSGNRRARDKARKTRKRRTSAQRPEPLWTEEPTGTKPAGPSEAIDKITAAVLKAVAGTKPVFVSDIDTVDGLAWERTMRANKVSQLRFVSARGRYRALGSLVLPSDMSEFAKRKDIWAAATRVYRGNALYEIGALLHKYSAQIVSAKFEALFASFRIVEDHGLTGVVAIPRTQDFANEQIAASIVEQVDLLMHESLGVVMVLTTNIEQRDAVIDMLTRVSRDQDWAALGSRLAASSVAAYTIGEGHTAIAIV